MGVLGSNSYYSRDRVEGCVIGGPPRWSEGVGGGGVKVAGDVQRLLGGELRLLRIRCFRNWVEILMDWGLLHCRDVLWPPSHGCMVSSQLHRVMPYIIIP